MITARVPPSKSQLQRALVLASLAAGSTRLDVPGDGAGWPADADRALELVRAAGAQVTLEPGARTVLIEGRPEGWCGATLRLGESGTLARLATAAAALAGRPGAAFRLLPEGTLRGRSSPALVAALRQAGCQLTPGEQSTWPLELTPAREPGGPARVVLVEPGSSQEVTALLIALAASAKERELVVRGAIPSRPYVDITLAMLARFGVDASERTAQSEAAPGLRFVLRRPLIAPPQSLAIEPDASAAAVLLAAGCLSGSRVRVRGLGPHSVQGDVRIVEWLQAFGCEAGFGSCPASRGDADASLAQDSFAFAGGAPRRGVELDLGDTPDLAPVLAALAHRAALTHGATSRLTGLETLPGKESSRIRVLAGGLKALGARVEHDQASLTIAPGSERSDGALELDPEGDHRMAFAFALASLGRSGVRIRDPGCVGKSWPGFWATLHSFAGGGAAASS